ncbi:MAG: GLPGLI family protein, partial [Bacteroidetes bacterium HGW-Bacteroidetes-22]
RGRDYIAWFAPDLPISEGPYKFSGLPGLILEVTDTHSNFHFQCTGIRKINPAKPIKLYDWPYIRTTRKDLNAFLIKMYNDPFGYFKSKGQTLQMIENGKEIDKSKDHWPYNPVETE